MKKEDLGEVGIGEQADEASLLVEQHAARPNLVGADYDWSEPPRDDIGGKNKQASEQFL